MDGHLLMGEVQLIALAFAVLLLSSCACIVEPPNINCCLLTIGAR